MRLTVIGCSPAWPNPGGAQSGYLVEEPHGRGRLLLDCGPGVLARLRERGPLAVDAVAITHFHLDHCGDLVGWAWLNAYGPRDERTRPELWLPPGGRDELARFAEFWGIPAMWRSAFDVREYGRDAGFRAAGFDVVPRRLPHYGLEAYGFRVAADGRTLAYSGDCGPDEALAELARDADLFLCEATLSTGDADGDPRGHLSADEALAAADGRIMLTHRPAELPSPDGVELAHDGLVVDI